MVLLGRKEQRIKNRAQIRLYVLFFVLCSLFSACSPLAVVEAPTPTPPTATATPQPTPTLDPDVLAFPNGHTVRGAFRTRWQAQDGALLFGQPLTEALWVDGRVVQYFERARFEQQADGTIVPGALGREALADAPGWVTRLPAAPVSEACALVEPSGLHVCGAFREFWQQHGGADSFGAPLTEAVEHDRLRVQYFERARLEQPLGRAVQLSALGDQALARLPASEVLRAPTAQPAPQRASITAIDQVVQPLQPAQATLEIELVSGAATIVWGDRRGHVWSSAAEISDGRADLISVAQGALGPQGAVVMLGQQIAGVSSAVYQLDAASAISTGQPRFDELLPRVKAFMDQDISEYTFGENRVRGYRSPDNNLLWLRDHVHQSKGFAYWEQDMISLLDQFRRNQYPDGSFDDYLGQFEFGELRGRKEVEADLEYLFVEGVYRAWQATGDDDWLKQQTLAMERGLHYALTDARRWDPASQLVKRPYTIDTWDFEVGPPTIAPDGRIAPRHWIDDQTRWSIFHGDNTGYAQAMELLARMYDHLGQTDRAAYWRAQRGGLLDRLNRLAWNGRFYQHMVPLVPVELPVDTAEQLSLSNAYALNRGVLTAAQGRAILEEYQRRRRPADQAFAEWYSIDPPFPPGVTSMPEGTKGHLPGEYVNGGIMPLVGGELAQGAFRYGYERYGFDILQRYYSLIAGTGASYLWYYPIGQPGISGADTLPTDGWGASAMLAGLVEGAAGIQDAGVAFSQVQLAPRWAATPDVTVASMTLRYGAGQGYVAYRWERRADGIDLRWTGSGQTASVRVLLPDDAPETVRVLVDGQPQTAMIGTLERSRYVEVAAAASGELRIRW